MDLQVQRMRLHRAIETIFASNFPLRLKGIMDLSTPYLAGKPGGGKTQSIRHEAYKRDMHFVSRNLGLARLEEFGGIPDFIHVEINGIKELHTVWSVPELLHELRIKAQEKPVICLLDDWHLATPSISAIGYELFSDYTMKGYKIPSNVLIILAGNDSPAAGARSQFSAIMNRVEKILVETDFDYWRDNYAFPHNLFPPIISFLEAQDYRSYFHGEEDVYNPFPSPRSWTNLSFKILGLSESGLLKKLTPEEELIIIASHVGIVAASKFQTYYRIYMTFDTKKIYDTGKFEIPSSPIDRIAFTFATASEFYNRIDTDKKSSNVYASILTALNKSYKEMAMASIRYLANRNKELLLQELVRNKTIDMTMLADLLKTSNLIGGK